VNTCRSVAISLIKEAPCRTCGMSALALDCPFPLPVQEAHGGGGKSLAKVPADKHYLLLTRKMNGGWVNGPRESKVGRLLLLWMLAVIVIAADLFSIS
jgi:hypothetical protein